MKTMVELIENGDLDVDQETQLLRKGRQWPIAVCDSWF